MFELKPERLNIPELTNLEISICGKSFLADMSGALYWPSQRALIVADLDLTTPDERGGAQPSDTLSALASVIDTYSATHVIALGECGCADLAQVGGANQERSVAGQQAESSFDDCLNEEDRKTLAIIQDHCSWTWVSERDYAKRNPALEVKRLGGKRRGPFEVEGLTLRHQPTSGLVTHEISGGLRPCARVSRFGHEIRRPCFVTDGLRIVLPAFSTFAGGQNILGSVFEPMFGSRGMDVLMLGHDGLYSIAPRLLKPEN